MERLYKILTHDAKAAHGGAFDYNPYLPKYRWDKGFKTGKWIPGKWLKHKGSLKMCASGFHLTSNPLKWNVKKGRVFLCEFRGEYLTENVSDKICFKEIRMLCELGIDSLDLDVKLFKIINSGLRDANLSGADLSGADLSGAYLSGANLSGANLSGANLSGADLSGADLSGAYFWSDPKIKGWKFENGQLWRDEK